MEKIRDEKAEIINQSLVRTLVAEISSVDGHINLLEWNVFQLPKDELLSIRNSFDRYKELLEVILNKQNSNNKKED